MTEKQLRKELNTFDKKVLLEILLDLFNTNKSVQEQLEYYLKPDIEKVLKEYKKKIEKLFSPSRDTVIKISDPQKLINEFKRLDPPPDSLIDFLLFTVEEGICYINTFLDDRYRFYEELGVFFEDAFTIIEDEGLENKYKKKFNSLINYANSASMQLGDIISCYSLSDHDDD